MILYVCGIIKKTNKHFSMSCIGVMILCKVSSKIFVNFVVAPFIHVSIYNSASIKVLFNNF